VDRLTGLTVPTAERGLAIDGGCWWERALGNCAQVSILLFAISFSSDLNAVV